MDYYDAIKSLAKTQGITLSALCDQAGHANSYIATNVRKGNAPTLTTATKLAAPLGYGLALVPLDATAETLEAIGAIPLDSTPREQ